MVRIRVRVSVTRHDSVEQAVQGVQGLSTQLTGQAGRVQLRMLLVAAQEPPFAAGTMTVRVRICVPLPHVTEHARQPVHVESLHGTGQTGMVHACFSVSEGHGMPLPRAGLSMVRVRV